MVQTRFLHIIDNITEIGDTSMIRVICSPRLILITTLERGLTMPVKAYNQYVYIDHMSLWFSVIFEHVSCALCSLYLQSVAGL